MPENRKSAQAAGGSNSAYCKDDSNRHLAQAAGQIAVFLKLELPAAHG